MTKRHSMERMTGAVILLGIISMVIGAYDGTFQAFYSLRWTGLLTHVSETVARLLPAIITLPVLLCAAFSSAGKKQQACVCGIVGAALHAVMAIGTVVKNSGNTPSLNAIVDVAMAVVCVLIIIAMDDRHRKLGYVVLAIAVLSLIGTLVMGARVYKPMQFKSSYCGWGYYFSQPQFTRLFDSYYSGIQKVNLYGWLFIPLSKFPLFLGCALAVLCGRKQPAHRKENAAEPDQASDTVQP